MKLCNFFSKDTTKRGGCQGGEAKKWSNCRKVKRTTPLTPIVSTIFRPYPTKGSEYFCTFAPLQASGHGRMGGRIKALTAVVFVAIGIPAQASLRNNKKMYMKKTLTVLLFLFPIMIFGQVHRYYCEIKGVDKDFSTGLKIIFDFGTSHPYNSWGGLNNNLTFVDNNGKEIEFNSMVDAANYMVDKGWTFQQAYSSVSLDRKPTHHWIFYKDADSFEKAREGIKTKDDFPKKQASPDYY